MLHGYPMPCACGCGKKFIWNPALPRKRYYSRECSISYKRDLNLRKKNFLNNLGNQFTGVCPVCKNSFYRRNKKFCGIKCKDKFWNNIKQFRGEKNDS